MSASPLPIDELVQQEASLTQEVRSMKLVLKSLTKRSDRGLVAIIGMRLRLAEAELDYVRWAIEAYDSKGLREAGYVPF